MCPRLEQIGEVGIDSGQVMIVDPCNDGKIRPPEVPAGAISTGVTRADSGVTVGVVSRTAFGDGGYPVLAVYDGDDLRGIYVQFQ